MRASYDFSKAKPNPYAKRLKKQITISPGQAFRCALKQGEVLISPATLGALAEVLQREKCD